MLKGFRGGLVNLPFPSAMLDEMESEARFSWSAVDCIGLETVPCDCRWRPRNHCFLVDKEFFEADCHSLNSQESSWENVDRVRKEKEDWRAKVPTQGKLLARKRLLSIFSFLLSIWALPKWRIGDLNP
jgi:hypothetical protein